MTLSVLQSVYKKDNPQFLSESLRSLAEQTRPADCIVLVKDGTLTPELETVISEWQERLPLKVVGYNENKGLAHALNFGLQFVETDLVARMDSDDIALPERFEKQVCAFEIDESLQILGGGINEFYISPDREKCEKTRLYPKSTKRNSKKLYKGTPLAHPTVMIKTSLLKEFGYSEKVKCNEDIDLWFRILDFGVEIRTLQEPLVNFRITEGTFRRRSLSKAFFEFKIYFENLVRFNGVNKDLLYLFMRFASRFLPSKINRRMYFSKNRENLFREDFMQIRTFQNSVFQKGGHIFQALLEFEEDGERKIKARQIDTNIENIVEISADGVELFSMTQDSVVSV